MKFPVAVSKWKRRFAFFPHRCHVSKKLIWFKFGYKCNTYVFARLSTTYWRNERTHIVELLKGNDNPIPQPILNSTIKPPAPPAPPPPPKRYSNH
jgi:hypothetical protein